MAEQMLSKTLVVVVAIKKGSKELTTWWTKVNSSGLILEPFITYVLTRILFQNPCLRKGGAKRWHKGRVDSKQYDSCFWYTKEFGL